MHEERELRGPSVVRPGEARGRRAARHRKGPRPPRCHIRCVHSRDACTPRICATCSPTGESSRGPCWSSTSAGSQHYTLGLYLLRDRTKPWSPSKELATSPATAVDVFPRMSTVSGCSHGASSSSTVARTRGPGRRPGAGLLAGSERRQSPNTSGPPHLSGSCRN